MLSDHIATLNRDKEKTLDKKIQPDIVDLVKEYNDDKIAIGDTEVELSNINNIQIQ